MNDEHKNIQPSAKKSSGKSKVKSSHSIKSKPKESKKEEDPENILLRIQKMHKELDDKLAQLYASGLSKSEIDRLIEIECRTNFHTFEKIKKDKEVVIEKLLSTIKPESAIKPVAKSKEKLTKERKGKTLGNRKNWIPVR